VTALVLLQSAVATALMRARRVRCGVVTCDGRPPLLASAGDVHLGSPIAFRSRAARAEIGALAGGRLRIGARGFVNQGATIVATTDIAIGDDVRVGDHAAVYDSDYHALEQGAPVRRAPVRIGDNVWLARGAVVLPGSTIGDHAVVAAGAVVSGDVPARSLVAGSPARVVRDLAADEGWRRG
jgi:acetyltransferase-like isoleucine patch superfamily enzyme